MITNKKLEKEFILEKRICFTFIIGYYIFSIFVRFLSTSFEPILSATDEGHLDHYITNFNIISLFSFENLKYAVEAGNQGIFFRPFSEIITYIASNIYNFNNLFGYLILGIVNASFNLILIIAAIILSSRETDESVINPKKLIIFFLVFFTNPIFIAATSLSLIANQQVIPISIGLVCLAIYSLSNQEIINNKFLFILIPLSILGSNTREIYIVFPILLLATEFLNKKNFKNRIFEKLILSITFIVSFFPSIYIQLIALDFTTIPYSILIASDSGSKVSGYFTWERSGWIISSIGLTIFVTSVLSNIFLINQNKYIKNSLQRLVFKFFALFSILFAFLSQYIHPNNLPALNRWSLISGFISIIIFLFINFHKNGFFYLIWFLIAYLPILQFPHTHSAHTLSMTLPVLILLSSSLYDFYLYWENLMRGIPIKKYMKVVTVILLSIFGLRGFTIFINNFRLNLLYRDLYNQLTFDVVRNEDQFLKGCRIYFFGFNTSYNIILKSLKNNELIKYRKGVSNFKLPFYSFTKRDIFGPTSFLSSGKINKNLVTSISNKCGNEFVSTGFLVTSSNTEPLLNFPNNLSLNNKIDIEKTLIKPFDPLSFKTIAEEIYPIYGIDDLTLRWEIYGGPARLNKKKITYSIQEFKYEIK